MEGIFLALWHKKINLLDFVDMMCKDMLNNRYLDGVQHTSGTTYSICAPPSKKRPALNVVENMPAARRSSGKLLNDNDLGDDDDDPPFEKMNDTQISDITMDPSDSSTPPAKHSLARTKQMKSYTYQVNVAASMDAGIPVRKKVAECRMRRKCTECKRKKMPMFCNTCFTKFGTTQWICSSSAEHECFKLHCQKAHRASCAPIFAKF